MSCRLILDPHTCLLMKCCCSDSICLNTWQSLGSLSLLASPAMLKLMAERVNERQRWSKNELVRTRSGRSKCRDKSDLPLPVLSARTALSVYSAYFPNGTVTKDSAGLSSPHRAISVASRLGNVVYAPIYTREELFSLCYLQHSRGLIGAKGDGRTDNETLDCHSCKVPINYIQDHTEVISRSGGGTASSCRGTRAQTRIRLFSVSPMQGKSRGGKGVQHYHRGESVVMAVLLWPCWLANSLTWDHFGQLTSILLHSEAETDLN